MKKIGITFLFMLLLPTMIVWASGGKEKGATTEKAIEKVTDVASEEAERALRIAFVWPTYPDPAVASDYSSSASVVNLYDSLVHPTAEGSIEPSLAERWEYSEDGLTYTFYLRQGVKFHDGTEMTAEDVAFSMDRITTIGEGFGYIFLGKVERTEVVDTYTVRFHLGKTYGPFVTTLLRLYVLNKDQVMANIEQDGPYGEFGDYGKEWLLTHDAGTGAYVLKEHRLDGYLRMEKFDDYWGEFLPKAPDIVEFIGATEAMTVKTAFIRKEIDFSDECQALETYNALDAMEGVDVASISQGSIMYWMMHTKKPPTDDVHFRKAMAYAVDYKSIVEKIYPGSGYAIGPVAPSTPGHNPNLPLLKERDIDKAMAELKKSKYYGKLDQYPVELHWCAEIPDEEKVSLLFQSNMADIGITVNVVKTPWLSIVEETGNIDLSPNIETVYVLPHYPEAGAMLVSKYHSDSAASWEQNEWLLNPELDDMLDDALATPDREDRFAKYYEIQELLWDICPSIYIMDKRDKHAFQSSYIEWLPAKGKPIPVVGYLWEARFIQVNPELK